MQTFIQRKVFCFEPKNPIDINQINIEQILKKLNRADCIFHSLQINNNDQSTMLLNVNYKNPEKKISGFI